MLSEHVLLVSTRADGANTEQIQLLVSSSGALVSSSGTSVYTYGRNNHCSRSKGSSYLLQTAPKDGEVVLRQVPQGADES